VTIESVGSGKKKFRVNPKNPFVVQIQPKHGARWVLFKACQSAAEATQIVMDMAREVKA
jgi:hypothetical protein